MYLLFVLGVVWAQDSEMMYLAQRFKSLQDNMLCASPSPSQHFAYGQSKVTDVKGIFFCDQYAKRTCCSEDNFNEVKRKWFREYSQATNMSPQCQEQFSKLVCYDCDGDVGQKIRKGLCPGFCHQLYKSCYYDVFSFEENQQKFRFCRHNDIFCSELRYIFTDGLQFCKGIGFEVNLNDDFSTWVDDLLANSSKRQPACWDSTPSQRVYIKQQYSKIFGPAFNFDTSVFEELKKKAQEAAKNAGVSPPQDYRLWIALGAVVVALIGAIVWFYKV